MKKKSSIEGKYIKIEKPLDMQWSYPYEGYNYLDVLNKEVVTNEDKEDYKKELEELKEMLQDRQSEEKNVISSEKKKLEIYTEDVTEIDSKNNFLIPRQYVLINGDKYYFPQEKVTVFKTKQELEVDKISQELSSSIGLTPQDKSIFKGSYYTNSGLLPNGNMILQDLAGMVGMVDSYGKIIVDFKYHSIKPITNRNNEIVHDEYFIAESNNSHFSNEMNNIVFSTGIINNLGSELYPIDESDVEKIIYDDLNDVFHCCNYSDYVGLAYSDTGFEKDRKTIYGYELSEDKYYDLEDKIFG